MASVTAPSKLLCGAADVRDRGTGREFSSTVILFCCLSLAWNVEGGYARMYQQSKHIVRTFSTQFFRALRIKVSNGVSLRGLTTWCVVMLWGPICICLLIPLLFHVILFGDFPLLPWVQFFWRCIFPKPLFRNRLLYTLYWLPRVGSPLVRETKKVAPR